MRAGSGGAGQTKVAGGVAVEEDFGVVEQPVMKTAIPNNQAPDKFQIPSSKAEIRALQPALPWASAAGGLKLSLRFTISFVDFRTRACSAT